MTRLIGKMKCVAAVLLLACAASADEVDKLRTYYFGNSLIGSAVPEWHTELGESAGKEWTAYPNLGAGWPLWSHREALLETGVPITRGNRGDLTLDDSYIKNAKWNQKHFLNQKWDAIVLQPFSTPMRRVTDKPFDTTKFDEAKDVGDLQSATDLIDIFLSMNADGKIYIYQDWPDIPRPDNWRNIVPKEDEWPEWAHKYKKKNGKAPSSSEFAYLFPFDYEQEWLGKKYVNDKADGRWWEENFRCQDFHNQLFEGLQEKFPDLWREDRLNIIPTADIYMALHKKAKEGEIPGMKDAKDFYTDNQHVRAGLPRYIAAASFFAAMFRTHPEKLDYKLYSDLARYKGRKGKGDDPHHDDGELFVITPEMAKVVNDTIWDVVSNHKYTKWRP